MPNKPYKIPDNTPETVSEPAVAYRKTPAETSSSDSWNPNVPFHGTQEEWWDHIHQIEEGHFMSAEEHKREFAAWKKEYLANRTLNPNVPFHGTQEEWWDHFHRIEEGPFSPVSELHQRISKWMDNQEK
jgi:hypothetical protein